MSGKKPKAEVSGADVAKREKPYKSEASNVHSGHRERMYDRFLADGGFEHFQPHEVLEFLLYRNTPRSDTNKTAHLLLDKYGSLLDVLRTPPAELCKTKGLTLRAAADLYALYQAQRLLPAVGEGIEIDDGRPVLDCFARVVSFLQNRLVYEETEIVYVVCLDNASRLIKTDKLTDYMPAEASVNIRTIVYIATVAAASGVILAHNHPTGKSQPSAQDKELTRLLADALAAIGIPLLDHIIIARGGNFSFSQTGLILDAVANGQRGYDVRERVSEYMNRLPSKKS
jgi:DNA repair protein RadC